MFPQSLDYEYSKVKKPIYVRVRCPCCGMWTRLDNLRKENDIEECSTYSFGRARLLHVRKKNPSLCSFWIGHLRKVLSRLGFVEEVPYEYEPSKEVEYEYVKGKEEGYPYVT